MKHSKNIFLALLFLCGMACAGLAQSDAAQLEISRTTTPGDYVIAWPNTSGFAYFVETSLDLVNWSFAPVSYWELDALGTPEHYFGFTREGPKRFFRVLYSDDPSSDLLATDYNASGLSAWEQIQLGYNPFDWVDTVGNGMHDAWEEFYFGVIGQSPTGNDDGDIH